MVSNRRIKLIRRWHRKFFGKHDPRAEYWRRFIWFFNHDKKEFAWPLVWSGAGLALSVLSLLPEFHDIALGWHLLKRFTLLAGLGSLALGYILMRRSVRSLMKKADDVKRGKVYPEDYEYLPPYSDWRNSKNGDSAGWRHDDLLDEWLFSRPIIGLINKEGWLRRWVPVGNSKHHWTLWGGRKDAINEWKVRLASDLYAGVEKVEIERTDYPSSIVTNHLCLRTLRIENQPKIEFKSVGLTPDDRIPTLSESNCSNHIGGDLLVVAPGIVWLTESEKDSEMESERHHCSASGSFDWDSDRIYQRDLLGLVESGLRRELTEEARFTEEAAAAGDVRIVRYARATYSGGKPQFLALCRYPNRNPDLSELGDEFTAAVEQVAFEPEAGIRGLVAALDNYHTDGSGQAKRQFSRPLAMCVELLRELADGRGNQDIVDWLTKDWNWDRSLSFHVIPVGNSLLDFAAKHQTPVVQKALALGDAEIRSYLRKSAHSAAGAPILFEDLDPDFMKETSSLRDTPDACAEWASVSLEGEGYDDSRSDRIYVLLANATAEGLQAALGVATRFASRKGFYYIDGKDGISLDRFEPGNVYVCRIPGLKRGEELPQRARTSLELVGRAITDAASRVAGMGKDGRIVFHFNADYGKMDARMIDVADEATWSLDQPESAGWSVHKVMAHKVTECAGDPGRWMLTRQKVGSLDR